MKAYKILPNGDTSRLSVNNLWLYNLPAINGMKYWNGKRGCEIYSKQRLKEQVEYSFHTRFGTEQDYIDYIKELIEDPGIWSPEFVKELSELALGFSCIFYLLVRQPKSFVKANRLEESDCNFWKQCKIIIMYANFMQGAIGRFIEEKINKYLWESRVECINVRCCISDITPSLLGCVGVSDIQEQVFVYDFGSTRIKRGFVDKRIMRVRELESFYIPDHDFETCNLLHTRIFRTIINDVRIYSNDKSGRIVVSMCISNNILHGEIIDRGRYGILKQIGKNYQFFLQDELQKELKREIHVHIMNDAEAVSRIYTRYSPHAAVITLGTAIGIGYPPVIKREDIIGDL